MKYIVESDINTFPAWSGAVNTLDTVIKADKINELESLIESVFADKIPTMTEVNDFLWFDADSIFEELGIEDK